MSSDLLEKFEHEFISIEPLNKKYLKVDIIKDSKSWESFLDKSLDYSKEDFSFLKKEPRPYQKEAFVFFEQMSVSFCFFSRAIRVCTGMKRSYFCMK